MNLNQTREILESAVRRGGRVLMEHYGKVAGVKVKESISSVVTDADIASEKAIIEILEKTPFPCNIISEEAGYMNRSSRFTWVVDPLDGTSNFAAGLPWFGIIIALLEDGMPLLGAMYLPVDDDLYYAEKEKGAWKNNQIIKTTSSDILEDQLIAYSFDFSDDPGKTSGEMALLKRLSTRVRNTRSTNSLIDLCFTADGRLGAAINQSTKIWDIAGSSLIITEAGGSVTDINGTEIRFDLSPGSVSRNYTIVAAGSGIHTALIRIVDDLQVRE